MDQNKKLSKMLNAKSDNFKSYFKINGVSILPPLIDGETRRMIKEIRSLAEAKEKQQKNKENIAKQSKKIDSRCRSGSFTITSPVFQSEELPNIVSETSESTESLCSVKLVSERDVDKSEKDLKNEINENRPSPTPSYDSVFSPQSAMKVKELLEKQKREYLMINEALKRKFEMEQRDLINSLANAQVTSTPCDVSLMTFPDDDAEFTEFKTCLLTQSQDTPEIIDEKTIVNEQDTRIKAATIINAYARGFFARRLLRTIYVQDHIRNIKDTLQLVLDLDQKPQGSPIKNILMKTKLFRQLESDLLKFHEIFFQYSVKERIGIICSDRDIRSKKIAEENNESLSLSFQGLI